MAIAHPIFYGVPAEVIRDLCGVSLRQAIAYKDGKSKAHPSVIQLVTLYSEGRIFGREFDGWSVRGSDVVDPEGNRSTQSQLRAYPFVWQLARELSRNDPVASSLLDRYASILPSRLKRDAGEKVARARAARPASSSLETVSLTDEKLRNSHFEPKYSRGGKA